MKIGLNSQKNGQIITGIRKKQILFSWICLLVSAIAPVPSIAAIDNTQPLTTAQQNIPMGEEGVRDIDTLLEEGSFAEAVTQLEKKWEIEYENYFGANLSEVSMSGNEMGAALAAIARETGKKPAIVYLVPHPTQLELLLVTPDGKVIHKGLPEANRKALLRVIRDFRQELTNPIKIRTTSYLAPAKQLYEWAIAPLESELEAEDIDTLIFCVGAGLRSLPFAALHDGEEFLVEKYSIGLIPAFNMIEMGYDDLRNAEVLAMGASIFEELPPLPAVPVELSTIAKDLWEGDIFLNQAFTLENLRSQIEQQQYKIIHLATHADFLPGKPSNSYIQFWDTQLTLDRMRQLNLDKSFVGLLVLSACKTAMGDKEAEMGFAGLAVQSGVNTALASLWYVSDAGTLALMQEFYDRLRKDSENSPPTIKAEALRQAQLAMLKGEITLEEGQILSTRGTNVPLPPELSELEENFSHPYYWAGFTMIGSPW